MRNGSLLETVDRSDKTPKYLQAQRILIDAIRSGHFPAGAKLPSTKDISAAVHVSLITAHKALDGLVQSGWLKREVGRGTFVRDEATLALAERQRIEIGLLVDRQTKINDYYHATVLEGLRREARLVPENVEFFFLESYAMGKAAGRRGVGLMCMHPPEDREEDVRRLAEYCPVLVVGGSCDGMYSVSCDNYEGARDAVEHLLELRHRRYTVVTGRASFSNSRDRAAGVEQRLNEVGIGLGHLDKVISSESANLDDDASRRLVKRLRDADRPTAIIAGGFFLALGALRLIRQCGLRVPQDVSLVGFDDPESASLLDPPLTTVRLPLMEMARQAFRMTRAVIDTGAKGHLMSLTLPTELRVRRSTAICEMP